MTTVDGNRLRAWERRTGPALTGLGALFLVAYAVPILNPDLSREWRVAAEAVEIVTWVTLAADLAVRARLSHDTRRFLRTHAFDLLVLLLPFLRPLRALRLISIVVLMHRRVASSSRLRLSTYVAGTAALLVFVASLAVLDAERRDPDANIGTYFDSLWWTMTTVSTVGYGDHYPVTVEGRLIAMALMIGGVGLLGFITGSLATFMIDHYSRLERAEEETREDVADLATEVNALRTELARLRAEVSDRGRA